MKAGALKDDMMFSSIDFNPGSWAGRNQQRHHGSSLLYIRRLRDACRQFVSSSHSWLAVLAGCAGCNGM
jgi:hypothetical protein